MTDEVIDSLTFLREHHATKLKVICQVCREVTLHNGLIPTPHNNSTPRNNATILDLFDSISSFWQVYVPENHLFRGKHYDGRGQDHLDLDFLFPMSNLKQDIEMNNRSNVNGWRTIHTGTLLQQLQKDMRAEFERCIITRDENRAQKEDTDWPLVPDEHDHQWTANTDQDRDYYQDIDDRLTVLYTELMNDLTLPGTLNPSQRVVDISVLLAQLQRLI